MFKWFSRKSDKLADEILAENSKQESGKQNSHHPG
jgi:hypothetical protein